jgi:hypothetical protein
MENQKYPIREDWEEYYNVLENIRQMGICNMWGASVPLKQVCPELSEKDAGEILCNWISNYNTLAEMYKWRQ